MIARGRVQRGVVVLADEISLPEGLEVTVYAAASAEAPSHGVLDIPSVSLGRMLGAVAADDDLLGEMLENRS